MFARSIPTRRCVRQLSSKVVVVTSGKGGVGKTTTAASIAYGLAELGHSTVVIDFDIGLRNLDVTWTVIVTLFADHFVDSFRL
jgi:MinD-like ATPase involved in chromosome partitioning or flagellar assembly